jgi:hypothetical protein
MFLNTTILKKQKLLLCSILLLSSIFLSAQTYTISGYIQDGDSGEGLISANVFDKVSASGTVSNNFGFYSITLPAGNVDLEYSYIGFASVSESFELTKDLTLNISLPTSFQIDEVVISADKSSEGKIEERSSMSTIEVPIEQIKKIPALLGETDIIKALQLLPGVQSGGEGQSGLYVRGGSPDQNLILLDGVPVYNANHLFGFFSVFNADAIKDVKLIKGGFPARYGGRLSSVLEINMKEGNKKEFHGEGSIGVVASKLTLEGPISEKTSFIVSGRRTYIDILARPLIRQAFEEDGVDGDTGYFFYDLNAKVNHTFSDKDKIYLSAYLGEDKFFLNSRELSSNPRDVFNSGLGWGNVTTALRWNHLITPKLFLNTTATYSLYGFDVNNSFGEEFDDPTLDQNISLDYTSGIQDYALKFDFDYLPIPDHFVRFGINAIRHDFNPGKFDLRQTNSSTNINAEISQDSIAAWEFATYVEDDFVLGENFKINLGLHGSAFNVKGKTYGSLQPRVSARYLFDNDLAVKGSFATMQQYIHLLSNEGIGLPTDLWLPSTDRIQPQNSWQVALGMAKTLGSEYELSIEGYYKELKGLISYAEGSGLFEFGDWQDRVVRGDGDSYGIELFLQKKKGRLNGWIGYTLSKSTRTFESLNFGNPFPYTFDRRHDLSIVVNYKLSDKIDFGATWVYGTGNAISLGNSNYESIIQGNGFTNFSTITHFEGRNNFRMNSFHRLDFGFTHTKKKKRHTRTWSFGAYNAYNQQNPFFLFISSDFNEETQNFESVLKQASLFPIIPYIAYGFKF